MSITNEQEHAAYDADSTSDEARSGVRIAGHEWVPPALVRPLQEAFASTSGGEVVVRTLDRVGRIYVTRGAIAWVVCDAVKYRLSDVLESDAGLGRDELRATIEDCRRTGANFGETLMRWQLIDQVTLRRCLLLHNAHHFLGLLRLGEGLQAFFIPQARVYASELLFGVQELFGTVASLLGSTPPPGGAAAVALAEAARALPEALALAAVHLPSKSLLGAWPSELAGGSDGVELGRAIAELLEGRALVSLATATANAPVRPSEIVLMEGRDLHLVTRSTNMQDVVLFAVCAGGPVLGMALSNMRRVLSAVAW